VIIIILSIFPDKWLGKLNYMDKLFHFAAYGLLSFILFFALYFQNKINLFKKYPSSFTLLITTIFGILNEIFQIFVPSRTANPLDVLSNILGSIIIVVLLRYNLDNLRELKRFF
jgi:VanZ family protein